MPNIAYYHPAIVHFAIALGIVGVVFRWASLTGRAPFAGPTAATLLILAAIAAFLAVHSGTQAHGPVERIPGARQAVQEHEEAGEWARNVFLVIGFLEIVALSSRRKSINVARVSLWGSAVIGIAGIAAMIRAGDLGGKLVYNYAGGIGIRSGDTTDVTHLYLAGLYQAAQQARTQQDSARAAALFSDMARQFPNDTNVRLLVAESQLRDKHDPRGALATLGHLSVAPGNRFLASRVAFLKADAYVAVGKPDSARAILQALATGYPELAERIKGRIAQIK